MEKFSFTETTLKGAYIIQSFYAPDERGSFIKDYNADIFCENNITHNLKETFYTVSKKGVIRALHFQKIREQAKLIRCIQGHIYDVIVDLRPNSDTFGKWLGFELTGDNHTQILVPEHFAHGYLVLESSIVSYKCAEVFCGEYDAGIRWDDETIAIDWPIEKIGGLSNLILSEKDKMLPSFKKYFKLS